MHPLRYTWRAGDEEQTITLVPVAGTNGTPYLFGNAPNRQPIDLRDFYIMTTPVTQALWTHVMGSNPAERQGSRLPVENVSWDTITQRGGFLDRINSSGVLADVAGADRALRFRLPSEAEWEYAARGGPYWRDGFTFSGSNDVDAVAWYGRRFSGWRRLVLRTFGWPIGWRLANRFKRPLSTRTHDVASKAPNQLGLYDMCGNVWEWCEDACVNDGDERRLRGGCHHNWDIHCTVSFRYGISRDAQDGCIGFRLVLAPDEETLRD